MGRTAARVPPPLTSHAFTPALSAAPFSPSPPDPCCACLFLLVTLDHPQSLPRAARPGHLPPLPQPNVPSAQHQWGPRGCQCPLGPQGPPWLYLSFDRTPSPHQAPGGPQVPTQAASSWGSCPLLSHFGPQHCTWYPGALGKELPLQGTHKLFWVRLAWFKSQGYLLGVSDLKQVNLVCCEFIELAVESL